MYFPHKCCGFHLTTYIPPLTLEVWLFLFCILFWLKVTATLGGMRWCSWLRHCATSQKVADSIPDGVIEIFH